MSEAPLPADILPPCWSDDVRMNALFAPFRCKSLNPESWDGKMKFWSELIKLWCSHKKDAFVSVAKAKSTFRRNGRTPACLELVVEDMVNSGALVHKDKYSSLTTPDTTGWLRWGTGKALSSGGVALRFVTSFLPSPFSAKESEDGFPIASINPETVYLMECVLKDLSQELLQAYPKTEARIGTLDELRKATGFANCSSEVGSDMFKAVLGYMLANKMATRKGELFKIALPGTAVQPISEQDATLHQLRTAEATLEEKAAHLYEKAEQERMAAVTSLRAGNKSGARTSLRRKNWLTQQYEDTEKLLDNVRQLAYRIQQADSDAKVLDTYKNTVNSMKKTQVEKGLEVDNVHDLMEDLNEIIESTGEVQKTLSTPVSSTLDDSELERELEELLAEPSEHTPGGAGGGGGDKSLQDLDKLLDGLVLESGSPDAGNKTGDAEKLVEGV